MINVGAVTTPASIVMEPTELRRRREKLGLSQEALARMVDVSRQTIINIETGKHLPNVCLAISIANILRTSVEALWDG